MKRMQAVVAAAALSLGASAFAGPVIVDFSSNQSVRHLGSFTGTAVYDNTTDKLTLNVTNTSAGALTAFAFHTEAGDKAKFEQAGRRAVWKNEPNRKGVVNARPFGKYEAGAAVHGTWGSTAAKAGLAAGKSAIYVFDITGSNASTLTTADFFTSVKPQIVASFAGFKHHKTDRAGGYGHVVVTTNTTTSVIGSTTTPNNDTPIIQIEAPVIIGPPVGKNVPPPAGSGGVAAVPLPPAAPAGLAMLGLLGLAGSVRRVRRVFA